MSKYPDQPPPYGFHQPPPQGMPPQPQGMPPPHMMHPQPAVVVIANPGVGPNSSAMTCPSCHHQISTKVVSETATKTHLMALILCLFLCWPCAVIPYCMDSCKNVNHYCPKCNAFLGTYSD